MRKTIYERNYKKIEGFAKEILEGKNTYMKFESPGFMRLVVESIGKDEISLAHYYEQNGDLMQDPEITIRINNENKTAEGLTFLQANLGIYYEVYPGEGLVDLTSKKEINGFLSEWLNNIKLQGYELTESH